LIGEAMDIKQLSEFCKTAIPFLGMTFAAMQIYFDAPKDRKVYVKQGFTFICFAVLAYIRVWG
jgi:hypothetical protein